jgi:hypothetical protein
MREIPRAESLREVVARGRQQEIDFTGLFALVRRKCTARGSHHGRMEPRDVHRSAPAGGRTARGCT